MKRKYRFRLHERQQEAWKALFKNPLIREVALISGVQGGKTIFGSLATRLMLKKYTNPSDNFLIGAPTYKIMEQATLPTFKKIHTDLIGDYNAKDNVFRLKDGRNVWFRTGTDPDSVEGIPDCVFAWMDEAGKCPRRFWVNFQGRVARRQGKILFTTTWYALNWLFKEVWRPYQLNKRSDIHVVSFNSAENPTFPREELERQRFILSPAEFQRKYLGEPGKVEGMVFSGFGAHNWSEPFDSVRYDHYGGIDWGFDHPTAIDVGCYPDDGRTYSVSVFKRSGLSVTQVLDLIESKHRQFHVKHWYCGHDRPDMIAELNKRGIPASVYFDGNTNYREVNAGNQLVDELMRSGKYKIFRGIHQAEDIEDEILSYAWREVDEGKETKEKPVGVNDDWIAATRYRIVGTHHLLQEPEYEPKMSMEIPETAIDVWDPSMDEESEKDWDCY